MVGLMAGVLLLAMSALRVGRLARYMPGLVVVGFTAGIALSIAFGQVNAFLAVRGTNPALDHFHQKAWDTLTHLGTIGGTTPALGGAAVLILLVWPRLSSRIPGALIAVAAVTAAAWSLHLDTPTIASRYGALPTSLPVPSTAFFDLHLVPALLPSAVAVAVLGAVESLLSAMVADGMSNAPVRHDPDRELRGQGLANLVSPLMGGIPATAAIARTGAGIKNGATSRLTGVFHALTVLAATLVLAPLIGHIPLTALAAVLLVVAWNIADVPEVVKLLRSAPREELLVLVSTLTITLFFDLSWAIAFGVLASVVLLMRRLVQVPAVHELLADANGRVAQVPPELGALMHAHPEIAFFNAQGVLSFHSAAAFEYRLHGADHRPLVLRMRDVHHVDTSGLLTLDGIIEHRRHRGERLILTEIQPEVAPVLERFGTIAALGRHNVFATTEEAIRAIAGTPSAAVRAWTVPTVHVSA
jgi:SulP family sulfate permease